jgi:hypothetical protein
VLALGLTGPLLFWPGGPHDRFDSCPGAPKATSVLAGWHTSTDLASPCAAGLLRFWPWVPQGQHVLLGGQRHDSSRASRRRHQRRTFAPDGNPLTTTNRPWGRALWLLSAGSAKTALPSPVVAVSAWGCCALRCTARSAWLGWVVAAGGLGPRDLGQDLIPETI